MRFRRVSSQSRRRDAFPTVTPLSLCPASAVLHVQVGDKKKRKKERASVIRREIKREKKERKKERSEEREREKKKKKKKGEGKNEEKTNLTKRDAG